VAVWPPPVPVTVMFNGFAVVDVRPVTDMVLDCPIGTELGLKEQVALLLQDRATEPRNVLGPATETVNVVLAVPIRTTLDRVLAERLNSAVPVPDNVSDGVFTASEVIVILPDNVPVAVGAKLIVIVQACPTLREAGTVGKLFPHVFVSVKLPLGAIFVMVTAWLPLLVRNTVWDGLVEPTGSAGNVSLEEENWSDPPVETPFPVTVIAWVTALPD